MFYIAGISISLFLGLLLFSKKKASAADYLLAVWLLIDGVHLAFYYLGITGTMYDYPALLGFQLPIPLLHGPFLYLYAAALTDHLSKQKMINALHFAPALLCYAYLVHFFLLPAEQKIYVFKNQGVGYETFEAVKSAAIIISGVAYVILTALLLKRHRRNILNQFSYTEKINLDWIQYLILGIALIWAFVIAGNDNLVFGTAVCFVIFIGYFGHRQMGIFSPSNEPVSTDQKNEDKTEPFTENEEKEIGADNSTATDHLADDRHSQAIEENDETSGMARRKYSKSGLSKESADQLHAELRKLMSTEKVFTESELTLTDLAKRLGTHPNYLSQIINEKERKNFYDYINSLRTEEFKNIVAKPGSRKFTLLSLAFECGFNSKSSFNKYFKKMTGLSPSEYLQQLRIEEAA